MSFKELHQRINISFKYVYSPETISFPSEVNNLFILFIIIAQVYYFIGSYSRLGAPLSTLYTIPFSLDKNHLRQVQMMVKSWAPLQIGSSSESTGRVPTHLRVVSIKWDDSLQSL